MYGPHEFGCENDEFMKFSRKKKLTASIRLRRHMELVHKRDEKSSHKKLEYYSYTKKNVGRKLVQYYFDTQQ